MYCHYIMLVYWKCLYTEVSFILYQRFHYIYMYVECSFSDSIYGLTFQKYGRQLNTNEGAFWAYRTQPKSMCLYIHVYTSTMCIKDTVGFTCIYNVQHM